jgi:hypothetical protein
MHAAAATQTNTMLELNLHSQLNSKIATVPACHIKELPVEARGSMIFSMLCGSYELAIREDKHDGQITRSALLFVSKEFRHQKLK